MSVEAMTAVLHHSKAKGTTKVILLGIANHDGDGGSWPSIATLAKYANVDPRNVRVAIARLVELGEVAVDVQGGGTHRTADHHRPNLYRVLVRCPADCDGSVNHRSRKGGTISSGGDDSIRGGGMISSGEGGMPASSEPSLEPSENRPCSPAVHDVTPPGRRAAPRRTPSAPPAPLARRRRGVSPETGRPLSPEAVETLLRREEKKREQEQRAAATRRRIEARQKAATP